jgi:hypothetical protein
VESRADGQPVCIGEWLAQHDFIRGARLHHSAAAEVHVVQRILSGPRSGDREPVDRLRCAGDVENDVVQDSRCHLSHALDPGDLISDLVGRAPDILKNIREAVALVIGGLSILHRMQCTEQGGEGRGARRRDDRDRDRLPAQSPEIAEQLAIEGAHRRRPHHDNSAAARLTAFTR